MGSERFSLQEITRLYLFKHHLFRKATKRDLVRVVDHVCGLHAQVATTPYFSLWSRIEDFDDKLLDEALYKSKSLVKTWVMRGTLHVIPSSDLPIYNRALRHMWFEHHGRFMRAPDWPSKEERRNLIYPKIADALAQKPLTRKDLGNKVRSQLKGRSKPYERLFSGWGGILKETAYEGLTVHSQPCDREACFARLDKWLPRLNLSKTSEEEAQGSLLVKYLRGYGPATQQDFSLWSGLTAGDAKRAVENAAPLLEHVEVEGARKPFLILKEDLKVLQSVDLDEHVSPSLLPKFDPVLLGHKDRSRIIRDEYKKCVFKPKAGDIAPTVLVDGQVVGTWRYKKTKRALTITVKLFEKIAKDDLKEVKQRAEEMRKYVGVDELKLSMA